MFAKYISDRFLKSNSIVGIECTYDSQDSLKFKYVILNKEKNKITIQSSSNEIGNADELFKTLSKSIPVCLVINGKVLIHKKIQNSKEDNLKSLLQKVLPNADVKDFYLQTTEPFSLDNQTFVSLIRKNILDDLLEKFIQKNIFILNCSLGPFCAESVLSLLQPDSVNEDSFEFDKFKLRLFEGRIFDFQQQELNENKPKMILLESLRVEDSLLIPFACALEYLLNHFTNSAKIESINFLSEEFKQKKIFLLSVWTILVSFFTILLINFLLFDHYSKLFDRLHTEVALNQDQILNYENLKKEILEKENLLASMGLLDASKTSYYADQIASDIPGNILLNDLNVKPLLKMTGAEEDNITFSPKSILISGSCKMSNELNAWIKILKGKVWVGNITLLNYLQDKEEELGKFTLELKIK